LGQKALIDKDNRKILYTCMKSGKPAPPHYTGHRERLRARFLTGGFESLHDYELLELLLTYAIPMQDVKPFAKDLLSTFRSFAGVLDASPNELVKVKGLGEYSATLIRVVKACAEYYLKEEAIKRQSIPSLPVLVDYCRTSMGGLKDEQFRVIFLNSQNEIIAEETIQEGTVDQTVVYPRKVLEGALKHKATGLILVHNHPSGKLTPSTADRELTRAIIQAAQPLAITVHDHLIIAKQGYYSMAEHHLI
jgi:DNA repair protein RadC